MVDAGNEAFAAALKLGNSPSTYPTPSRSSGSPGAVWRWGCGRL